MPLLWRESACSRCKKTMEILLYALMLQIQEKIFLHLLFKAFGFVLFINIASIFTLVVSRVACTEGDMTVLWPRNRPKYDILRRYRRYLPGTCSSKSSYLNGIVIKCVFALL